MFRSLAQNWHILAHIAAWIAGVVGVFLTFILQMSLSDASASRFTNFAQFITALLAGLACILSLRAGRKQHAARFWTRLALVLVATAFLLFITYQWLEPTWSCLFAQRFQLVIGSEYTDTARAYVAQHPDAGRSCDLLIADFAGSTEQIWPRAQLLAHYLILATLFIVAWLVCAAAIVAVLFALRTTQDEHERHGTSRAQ